MGAKELKAAILQEAISGRLVPQIDSEGNARDLLEEIRKEKLSHGLDFANAKSGKKKSKKETALAGSNPCDITEDEIPFDIPENWCWCRITDIATCELGKTKDALKNKGEMKDYLCSINIQEEGIDLSKVKQMKFEASEYERYTVKKNDLLICEGGDAGRCAIYDRDEPMYYQNALHRVRFFCDLNPKFYLYVFHVYKANKILTEASKGVTIQHLTGAALKELCFPLPPLAEQKRIVAAIEKFMPLIEEYGKKETQLKAINEKIGTLTKKAILQEAVQGKLVPQIASEGNARDLLEEIRKEKLSHGLDFANAKSGKRKSKKETALAGSNPCDIKEEEIPFDIPENWCWCRLSELCNLYTGDSINETEKKLKYTNIKEGWYYIGTKDVNFDQTINYDNGIKIPFEKDNFRIAPKNTVLMCIEGGSAGRKIAFTNQDVCFGNKLCCFNSYKNEIEKFIFYFLQSTLFTDAFKDNINGIIGGVSINNLKGMLFPLPPLAEQKRIVATIEKILPLCEKIGE